MLMLKEHLNAELPVVVAMYWIWMAVARTAVMEQ